MPTGSIRGRGLLWVGPWTSSLSTAFAILSQHPVGPSPLRSYRKNVYFTKLEAALRTKPKVSMVECVFQQDTRL